MKSNFNDQVYNSKSMQEIPFTHKQSLAENIGFQKLKDTVLSRKNPGASFAIVSQYNDRARQPQLRVREYRQTVKHPQRKRNSIGACKI